MSEGTAEQCAELERWLEGRPEIVQTLARKYPPWTCYRSTENALYHYVIMSYGEDGTLRLVHGNDSTMPGFNTYGQKPEQLVPCGCGKWSFAGDLLGLRDALEAENGVMPEGGAP